MDGGDCAAGPASFPPVPERFRELPRRVGFGKVGARRDLGPGWVDTLLPPPAALCESVK